MKDEVEVRRVAELEGEDLRRLVRGYVSEARYRVSWRESGERVEFALELEALGEPYVKRYDRVDEETMAHYRTVGGGGYSFGAYEGGRCVGVALAEARPWNRSLWVWELHVAETHRRQGVGRRLVEALVEGAEAAGLRTIVCETQNTNVPAIEFYRRMGFRVEGVDLSYYSNEDFPDGEVAVFMKRRVGASGG